jgi:hypothetical protein
MKKNSSLDLGKDAEGYEEYLVVMEAKNGLLLIRKTEN